LKLQNKARLHSQIMKMYLSETLFRLDNNDAVRRGIRAKKAFHLPHHFARFTLTNPSSSSSSSIFRFGLPVNTFVKKHPGTSQGMCPTILGECLTFRRIFATGTQYFTAFLGRTRGTLCWSVALIFTAQQRHRQG
jgi:hypothetical protein